MKFEIILFLFYTINYFVNATHMKCGTNPEHSTSLASLIQKSKISDDCLNVSLDEFAVQYTGALFWIRGPFLEGLYDGINVANAFQVRLQNFDLIKSTLNIFGGKIEKIQVSFDEIGEGDAKEIMNRIKDTCSDSLQMLALESFPEYYRLGAEFKLVNWLTFSSDPSTKLKSTSANWSTMFPMLKKLHLKYTFHWNYFEGNWPNLDEFSVQLSKSSKENERDSTHVVNFFKANPKIKWLKIENCNLNLLKEVNNHLPELAYFTIKGLSENYMNSDGVISLKKLRLFEVYSELDGDIPSNIVFTELYKIRILIQRKLTVEWLEFISKLANVKLDKFTLHVQEVSKDQFLSIAKNIPTVKEVHIACASRFIAADISSFIEKVDLVNLHILELEIQMDVKEQDVLEEKLPFNWIINGIEKADFGRVKISLERLRKCKPGSLDELKLADLVKRSHGSNCLHEARHVFKMKYESKQFIIRGPFQNKRIAHSEETNEVYLEDLEMIEQTLDVFGDMLHRIDVQFDQIDVESGQEIVRQINNECFDSLVTIKLQDCKGSVLDDLIYEFPYVYSLTFSSSATEPLKYNTEERDFNDIFPELDTLIMDRHSELDWALFSEPLRRLRKLSIKLPKMGTYHSSFVVNFLQENNRIQDFTIKNSKLSLLNEANDLLPLLKTLELRSLPTNDAGSEVEMVNFKRVRHLSIESNDKNQAPTRLHFEILDSIHLKIGQRLSDEWVDFIKTHVNSDVLNISLQLGGNLLKEHFLAIPSMFYGLEEVFISSQLKITNDDIAEFLKYSKKLNRLTLQMPMITKTKKELIYEADKLSGLFANDWHVKYDIRKDAMVSIEMKHKRLQDCSSKVLEEVWFPELLAKSNINEDCLKASQMHFISNGYNHFKFVLAGPSLSVAIDEITAKKTIYIEDPHSMESTLDHFGHIIQSLNVDFNVMRLDTAMKIVKIINEKCAATLEELTLLNCKGEVFNVLGSVKFPKVTTFIFSSHYLYSFKFITALKFNEIFPSVVGFSAEQTRTSDWSFFEGNLSHLKYFFVTLPFIKGNNFDQYPIRTFIKQNTQIYRMGLVFGNLQILKEVSESLKRIKYLAVSQLSDDYYSNYDGGLVRFGNVEAFHYKSPNFDEIPANIRFDYLENLQLDLRPNRLSDKWIQFISDQVTTKCEEIILDVEGLSVDHLLDIAEKQPNLKNFEVFSLSSKFEAGDVKNFIERAVALNTFYMFIQMDVAEQNRLGKILPVNLGWTFNLWASKSNPIEVQIQLKRQKPVVDNGENTSISETSETSQNLGIIGLTPETGALIPAGTTQTSEDFTSPENLIASGQKPPGSEEALESTEPVINPDNSGTEPNAADINSNSANSGNSVMVHHLIQTLVAASFCILIPFTFPHAHQL